MQQGLQHQILRAVPYHIHRSLPLRGLGPEPRAAVVPRALLPLAVLVEAPAETTPLAVVDHAAVPSLAGVVPVLHLHA